MTMALAASRRPEEEPRVLELTTDWRQTEYDDAPTTLLISSTRFLKPFHFTPPTRRSGY